MIFIPKYIGAFVNIQSFFSCPNEKGLESDLRKQFDVFVDLFL
ncbi:MAG: hypothetical protein ACD_81C00166G0005 [uncultured bacterium]|uniref:Uncharacterized protein n=2 Tax=Candidatus Wolfeibacteriota TaxID=1752735 RepID=A0A0G1H9V8_9BACT|nr:MAG: hypothetical protein ACD_81C00166G0005 [uncultured bacterium]KKR12420.1 MAG: hypothetical protein UT41_C0002G0194 [Candidatus Wolfebacteria bacterium GW2011_GWC2_39_22]KKT43328.1 MAG: hypothetical protein UW32_C0002G0189 [Candidatus Wolfebacteria bacterium GW2011_GWE2_44_13]